MVEGSRAQDPRLESEEHGDTPHSHDVWTVANVVTVLRLILIPFAFTVLISNRSNLLAFALYAGAASTDWIDGQIARRTGSVTAVGKVIDPLVDRLLLASGVIGLYLIGRLPLWLVFVLVARDVYLLYGAYRLEQHKLRLPVTHTGKWTTAVLLSGFSLLMLGWPPLVVAERELLLGDIFVYVGLALSLTTALQYTLLARRAVARVKARTS